MIQLIEAHQLNQARYQRPKTMSLPRDAIMSLPQCQSRLDVESLPATPCHYPHYQHTKLERKRCETNTSSSAQAIPCTHIGLLPLIKVQSSHNVVHSIVELFYLVAAIRKIQQNSTDRPLEPVKARYFSTPDRCLISLSPP
jgi:hypothetical protein